jgi:hypothetical protein
VNGVIRKLIMALIFIAPVSARADGWAIRHPDGMALEGGYTDEVSPKRDAWRGGGALVWDWGVRWLPYHGFYVGGQWELSASYWDARHDGKTGIGSLADFGITPIFRIQTDDTWLGVHPFLEGAIGAHITTEDGLGDADFGSYFEFGDHLGGGIRFGDKGQYELNYRYQHLSHLAGHPNPGINFELVRFGYRW